MSGSYWLFFEFVQKLSWIQDFHREAIKAIISLFLSLASQSRYCVDSNNDLMESYNKHITTATEAFYNQVSNLFKNVYGLSFGRCGHNFVEYSSILELKVLMLMLCYITCS
jgi:hypothetical protein